jgi:Protein of unknown function (DUF3298)
MKSVVWLIFINFFLFSCSENNKSTRSSAGNEKVEVKANIEEKEPVWQSGLKISYQKASAEKCFDVPREDWMEEDPEPFCAAIKLKAIVVNLNDQKVASKINNQIVLSMTQGNEGETRKTYSLKSYANRLKAIRSIEDGPTEEELNCELIDTTNRLFSIQINGYSMMYSAAHPSGVISCLNFDLKTGNKIQINEILTDGYERKMFQIVKKKLFSEYGSEGWEFSLTKNITIHKNGLSFNYNQYEIGPYAMGAPSVFVKWSDIKELLKENPYVDIKKYLL